MFGPLREWFFISPSLPITFEPHKIAYKKAQILPILNENLSSQVWQNFNNCKAVLIIPFKSSRQHLHWNNWVENIQYLFIESNELNF